MFSAFTFSATLIDGYAHGSDTFTAQRLLFQTVAAVSSFLFVSMLRFAKGLR